MKEETRRLHPVARLFRWFSLGMVLVAHVALVSTPLWDPEMTWRRVGVFYAGYVAILYLVVQHGARKEGWSRIWEKVVLCCTMTMLMFLPVVVGGAIGTGIGVLIAMAFGLALESVGGRGLLAGCGLGGAIGLPVGLIIWGVRRVKRDKHPQHDRQTEES